jgi:hypothetical protein
MKILSHISSGLIIGSLLFIHSVVATEPGVVVTVTPAATTAKPADTKPAERNYIHKDPQACVNLKLNCEPNQKPFSDETGCGCIPELKIVPLKYQTLQIKEAGITIEYPKTWFQQGKDMAWSPNQQGTPLLGFKWTVVEQEMQEEWEPAQMLPKSSDWLGPFMIDLGWERGLLYFVQIKANKDQVTKPNQSTPPDKSAESAKPANPDSTPNKPVVKDEPSDLFEIHTIIPRMEAEIAYDFYARAHNLSQLKAIDAITQKFMQSVVLNSLKLYVSEDPKECKKISLDCNDNEEEFFDKDGCGCISHPQTEEVYDN